MTTKKLPLRFRLLMASCSRRLHSPHANNPGLGASGRNRGNTSGVPTVTHKSTALARLERWAHSPPGVTHRTAVAGARRRSRDPEFFQVPETILKLPLLVVPRLNQQHTSIRLVSPDTTRYDCKIILTRRQLHLDSNSTSPSTTNT